MNAGVRASQLQVGWKVNSLAADIASVRYRAGLPMLALESPDVHSRLFSSGLEGNLDGLDVLVIVKSFTPEDLRLAQLAVERGIRVVFDLCDNIFIDGYGRDGIIPPAQMLLSMAEYLSCIVTTTEPLAEMVRTRVPEVPVIVVPDGIETASQIKRIGRLIGEAKVRERAERWRMLHQRVRNVMRRIRIEGPRLLPALFGYAARRVLRVLRALRRRIHKQVHRRPELHASPASALHSRAGRCILWFGNHGAEHARFGMLDILEYRDALETIAAQGDIELVVISNNRRKYEEGIRPLAIPSRYVEWSPGAVDEWLRQASVVIIPNTLDPFSVCKSANRTVLALSHGVPVVATMTAALEPLAPGIHTGDPLEALQAIFANPERARQQALAGYELAERLFGADATRAQWQRVLQGLRAPHAAKGGTQPWLAVVLNLVQDLDLALPVLQEAMRAGLACEAWCAAELLHKSPRVLTTLEQQRIPFRMLPDAGELGGFRFPASTRALLTVAETNLGPHRIPRLLTMAANAQGVYTATLQHGFENVALSYDDPLHGCEKVDIAARRIYTWGPAETLHPRATAAVRARCVPVGCPKHAVVAAAELGKLLPKDRPVVGVFENLHWHRYSETYRKAFIEHVLAAAKRRPDLFFLLKPHHAGLWLTRRYEGERPANDNLLIADPQSSQWERHTASALLGHLSAVITTPSTVALDAARLGLPVAVAAEDLRLDNYRPLTLLSGEPDWLAFLAEASDAAGSARLQQRSANFVERVLVPGDAAQRIVADLRIATAA